MNNLVRIDFLAIFGARNIVFVAMLAVGGLCIFMSASNTTAYLELTGMAHTIALMTGIALVIFSSTSATAAQLFIGQKGWAKIFAIPFVLVGTTIIIFSIFSTLSLNYHKFFNIDAIKADMQEKVEKARSELMKRQQENPEGGNAGQWAMDNIDRLMNLAEQTGQSWSTSMQRIIEMSETLSKTEQQSIKDIVENTFVESLPRTFFGFMLGLETIDRKYFFDFFMLAIPAVFYDLIAPLTMTVVLFLMDFKTKKAGQAREVSEAPIGEPPKPKEEQSPDIKDLTAYIENAMQEEYQILPDSAVPNMDGQKCAKLREYLSSFIYKGNPLISDCDGQYVSIFDKVNLIRFITLQNNVQQKAKGELL
jgi:TM2 domain-containing membrane protein YozV